MKECLHYVLGVSEEMKRRREKHIWLFFKQLQAIHTYPWSITVFTNAIKYGWKGKWIQELPLTTLLELDLLEVMRKQVILQKEQFLKGYLIKRWGCVQQKWMHTTNSQMTRDYLMREVVIAMHYFVLNSWKERNEVKHGITYD